MSKTIGMSNDPTLSNLPASVKTFAKKFINPADVQPVGYTRFSTKMQKSTSTDRQVGKILEYCLAMGWKAPIIFSDEAVSGSKVSRDKFDAMFEHCRLHPSTPIVVESMSRIARDGGAYQEFFRMRRQTRAITHVYGMGEMDDLTEGLFQTLSAYEYRNLITMMRDGRAQTAAEGKQVYPLKWGVTTDDQGRIDFDEDAAPGIIRAFKLAAKGMGHSVIATKMNKEGIPGPFGQPWTGSFISTIIHHPIYAGCYVYRPGVLAWEQPPGDVPDLSKFATLDYAEGEQD